MEELIKELMKHMDKRFENLEQSLDHRFGQVDKRFEKIDQRFLDVDQRFKAMDQRFEKMDQRFEKMDNRFDKLEQDMNNNQIENRSYFKQLDSKLDLHQKAFEVVSSELTEIKSDIRYLKNKVEEHDTKLK